MGGFSLHIQYCDKVNERRKIMYFEGHYANLTNMRRTRNMVTKKAEIFHGHKDKSLCCKRTQLKLISKKILKSRLVFIKGRVS